MAAPIGCGWTHSPSSLQFHDRSLGAHCLEALLTSIHPPSLWKTMSHLVLPPSTSTTSSPSSVSPLTLHLLPRKKRGHQNRTSAGPRTSALSLNPRLRSSCQRQTHSLPSHFLMGMLGPSFLAYPRTGVKRFSPSCIINSPLSAQSFSRVQKHVLIQTWLIAPSSDSSNVLSFTTKLLKKRDGYNVSSSFLPSPQLTSYSTVKS